MYIDFVALFLMAVDPRLLMSAQFAEHLWLTSASDGITSYFINKKGKDYSDAVWTGGGMKMGKPEQRTVKNILSAVSGTDILNFKETKDRRSSQWDIKKVKSFGDTLQGVAESPSWGWDVYFKDEYKKKLGKFEYQLIHHEIGHTIGLSHPGERPTNPAYSQADTVMSYNVVRDRNGAVIPYGFTSSDASAIRSWWNTSGFEQQEYNQPESVGDFEVVQAEPDHDADHNHFNIKTSKFPTYKVNSDIQEIDFSQYWETNAGGISKIIRDKANGSSPLVVKFDKNDNIVDLQDWKGDGLEDGVSIGHLLLKGRGGDDTFILRGTELFEEGVFAKDLVVSGGKGFDRVILDSAFDYPNAKAGMLAGQKLIRFFGNSEEVEIMDGAKVIHADMEQGVIIRNDVEEIEINGVDYTFDELYGIVQNM